MLTVYKGYCRIAQEKGEEAQELLNEINQLDDQTYDEAFYYAQYYLAYIDAVSKRYDAARRKLESILPVKTFDTDVNMLLLQVFRKQGEHRKAMKLWWYGLKALIKFYRDEKSLKQYLKADTC